MAVKEKVTEEVVKENADGSQTRVVTTERQDEHLFHGAVVVKPDLRNQTPKVETDTQETANPDGSRTITKTKKITKTTYNTQTTTKPINKNKKKAVDPKEQSPSNNKGRGGGPRPQSKKNKNKPNTAKDAQPHGDGRIPRSSSSPNNNALRPHGRDDCPVPWSPKRGPNGGGPPSKPDKAQPDKAQPDKKDDKDSQSWKLDPRNKDLDYYYTNANDDAPPSPGQKRDPNRTNKYLDDPDACSYHSDDDDEYLSSVKPVRIATGADQLPHFDFTQLAIDENKQNGADNNNRTYTKITCKIITTTETTTITIPCPKKAKAKAQREAAAAEKDRLAKKAAERERKAAVAAAAAEKRKKEAADRARLEKLARETKEREQRLAKEQAEKERVAKEKRLAKKKAAESKREPPKVLAKEIKEKKAPKPVPTKNVTVKDSFFAFRSKFASEPTKKEWNQALGAVKIILSKAFKKLYAGNPETSFVGFDIQLNFTRFEEGIPDPTANLLMNINFELSYTIDSVVPAPREAFDVMVSLCKVGTSNKVLEELIYALQDLGSEPFKNTTAAWFRAWEATRPETQITAH